MIKKNKVLFLMFHKIIFNLNEKMSDYDVDLETFKKLIKEIHLYNKNNKDTLIVPTFDDGNKSDLTCAKYLNQENIKGIFFIVINRINKDGYLSAQDIIKINDLGHYIGSHTMTHLKCDQAKPDIVIKEMVESKSYLENLLKKECEYFAFPGGLYNKKAFQLAQKANFKYIFSTFEKLPNKLVKNRANPRMHIRSSTLKNFKSILKIEKTYYFKRYLRSLIREIKYLF